MKFLSVCSGIEAASAAWLPIGWEAVGFSEIDPFPSAVLAHHYPTVTNFGDITRLEEHDAYATSKFALLVGGTPCQSFSIAGLRKGLDDARGQLVYAYHRILERHRPRWMVWENVYGVLSSNRGRDFGAFLGGLEKCGYGFAYRVLDSQYFGVPQRRRRVFVVGYFGDWRPAAAVLFERDCLCWDFAKGKEKKKEVAGAISSSSFAGGAGGRPEGAAVNHFVTHQVSPTLSSRDYKGLSCGRDGLTGAAVVAIQANMVRPNARCNGKGWSTDNLSYTLTSADRHIVAFHGAQDPCPSLENFHPVGRNQGQECCVCEAMRVRRLTPIECERLQGFSDNYTRIPWRGKPAERCPDGLRYKAIGNSMTVPVMRWLGERIAKVEECLSDEVH